MSSGRTKRTRAKGITLALAGLCLLAALPASAQMLTPTLQQEGAAKLVTVQGQVSIFKDGYPWALKAGDTVFPKQEISSGPDGYAVFNLPDGSTFELFPNSRATFRANSGSLTELLDLWIGRVKVHIQKLNGKPNPNRVTTPTAIISVRGTIFDVTVEEEDVTLVLVEEGQVAVSHSRMPYSGTKLLNAGDYMRVYRNEPIARQRFDKPAAAQRVLNALVEMLLYRPRPGAIPVPGGTGGGGVPPVVVGDTGGGPTPPPPPPPPPPGN